jgi:hypothetical protein
MGLPRELRHNMRAIYCENRNGATLQTLFSGPRPFSPPEHAVVRAGLMALSPGPFFWAARSCCRWLVKLGGRQLATGGP